MRIVCDSCGAVYKIADDKLVKEVNKATCKRCGHKIIIRKPRAAVVEGPSERTVISSSAPPEPEDEKKKDEKTVITTIPELEKYESAAVSAGAIGSLTSELRTITAAADIPEPPATDSLGPGGEAKQKNYFDSAVSAPAPMPEMPKPPPPPSTTSPADGAEKKATPAPQPASYETPRVSPVPKPPPPPTREVRAATTPPPEPELPPPPAAPQPPPAPAPQAAPEPAQQAPAPSWEQPAAATPPPSPGAPSGGQPQPSPAEISIAIPPEQGPLYDDGASRDQLPPAPPAQPARDPMAEADLASAINTPPPQAQPAPQPQLGEIRTATRDVEPAPYVPKSEFVAMIIFALLTMLGALMATVGVPLGIGIVSVVGYGLIWSMAFSVLVVSILSGLGKKKGRALIIFFPMLIIGFGLAFGVNFGLSRLFVGTAGMASGLDRGGDTGTGTADGGGDAQADAGQDGAADAGEDGGDAASGEDATPEAGTDAGEDGSADATEATPEEPTPAPVTAPAIIFASSPSGADVYLDGRRLGRASYRYERGSAGRRYTVTCKKSGYEDATASATFPSSGDVTARCRLQKKAAEEPEDVGTASSDLPDASEVLTPAIIDAIVGSNAAIKRCFAEASARGDVVSGKIWVKFTVAPSGDVSKAQIVTADYVGTDLDSCVSGQINRLEFAPFAGSTSKTVKYPFVVR